MNMSKVFTQAHAMTKAAIKAGDDYRVTFGAAVKEIIADRKKVIRVTTQLEAIRLMNRWTVRNYSYVEADVYLTVELQNAGINCEKVYVDMNEGEFCFKNIRATHRAGFEGTEAQMIEKATAVTKAFLNARKKAI
jgi:hypothetical protein